MDDEKINEEGTSAEETNGKLFVLKVKIEKVQAAEQLRILIFSLSNVSKRIRDLNQSKNIQEFLSFS